MSTDAPPDALLGTFDVIIAGAGPTGLVLANLLGAAGVSTLVVERNPTTVQEPRAVSIDDESLRTIQATGLLETVMAQVVPGYGSRYLTPSGKCFLTVMPSGRPYGHPRRNAFRQPDLEQRLRDGLGRFADVVALFGWTMTDFSQDGNGVDVVIARAGSESRVRGRYLVGADGASSFVRKRLGIALEGRTVPERWLIVDLENSPAERDTVVFCDVARPCIALPGPDLTRRFEFKLFADEEEAELLAPDRVEQLLQSRGAVPGSRIVRQTVYTFHARLAERWREGRVFLAGDAAHLTPPFAGQGMNSGIRDAHNLAWKLAAVVSGTLLPATLDSYEQERREHVGNMIALALRMGRIMGPANRFTGWLIQTAFRIAGVWPGLRSYFGEMKYKPKPCFREGFLVGSDHPLPGRLLPQPTVRNRAGEEMLLDDALPEGFWLIGLGIAAEALAGVAQALRTIGLDSKPVLLRTDGPGDDQADVVELALVNTPDETLSPGSRSMLLVRPDRYVMAAFTAGQVEAVLPSIEALMQGKAIQDPILTNFCQYYTSI